jgi:hypothetical protein
MLNKAIVVLEQGCSTHYEPLQQMTYADATFGFPSGTLMVPDLISLHGGFACGLEPVADYFKGKGPWNVVIRYHRVFLIP